MSMRVLAVRYGSKRSVIAAGMRGRKGEQGEQGAAFQVDASGLLANRGAFDGEDEGFSYLATDTGDLYYRQGAAGNWSDPVPFQGPAGDSAYQVAVANGFVGTEADWLASLAGADGVDGADGLSITGAAIDGNGHLLLTLSNSTVLDAGYVVGPAGANGTNGADGADGADGRGIASMAIDGSNHLIITYTDTTTEDAGLIPGAGGSASWGSVGGTLASQTDLVAALADKANTADLAMVAETGSYNDLTDKPSIPSNTDAVAEGATNLYHTAARVLATVLSGLSLSSGGAVVNTDTVLVAFGKLQRQVNDLAATISGKQDTLVSGTSIKTVGGQSLLGSGDVSSFAGVPYRIVTASGAITPADSGHMIISTSATAITLTIGAEATAAWAISGSAPMIHFLQDGAGAVTITGDGFSVTTHASDTNVLDGQIAAATAVWRGTDAWRLFGRLVAA